MSVPTRQFLAGQQVGGADLRNGAVQSEFESTVGERVLNCLKVGIGGAIGLGATAEDTQGQLSSHLHL